MNSDNVKKLNELEAEVSTLRHIKRVNELLLFASGELQRRAVEHDRTKLEDPEKSVFAEYTAKLKDCTYGSDEYKGYLEQMAPALKHHYLHNRHHPEHFVRGVENMNLFDLIEMVVDWKSASERHEDGDIYRSIAINSERFGISDQLTHIIANTVMVILARGE